MQSGRVFIWLMYVSLQRRGCRVQPQRQMRQDPMTWASVEDRYPDPNQFPRSPVASTHQEAFGTAGPGSPVVAFSFASGHSGVTTWLTRRRPGRGGRCPQGGPVITSSLVRRRLALWDNRWAPPAPSRHRTGCRQLESCRSAGEGEIGSANSDHPRRDQSEDQLGSLFVRLVTSRTARLFGVPRTFCRRASTGRCPGRAPGSSRSGSLVRSRTPPHRRQPHPKSALI